jgi:hypothetical protein
MFLSERTDGRDLVVGPLDCPWSSASEKLRLYPDGKELSVQTSFFRAHGVEVTIRQQIFQIDMLVNEPLSSIRMHVDRDRPSVDLQRVATGVFQLRLGLSVIVHIMFTAVAKKR